MRLLLLTLVLLTATALTGCMDEKPTVPGGQTCPQHIMGKSTANVTNSFAPGPRFNSTDKMDELGAGLHAFQGYDLDQIQMNFHWEARPEGGYDRRGIEIQDGRLTLQLKDEAGNAVMASKDPGRNDQKSTWVFEQGVETNFTLYIHLVAPNADPNPRTVQAHWHFQRDLDQNPESVDLAIIKYEGQYWYRSC